MSSNTVIIVTNPDRLPREKLHRAHLVFVKTGNSFKIIKNRVSGFMGEITEAQFRMLKKEHRIWRRLI